MHKSTYLGRLCVCAVACALSLNREKDEDPTKNSTRGTTKKMSVTTRIIEMKCDKMEYLLYTYV